MTDCLIDLHQMGKKLTAVLLTFELWRTLF